MKPKGLYGNRGIGHFRDDATLLRFAAIYLENFPVDDTQE